MKPATKCPHCGWYHGQAPSLPEKPAVLAILIDVCSVFQVNPMDIVGQGRERHLVEVRQLVFAMLRDSTRLTLWEIGAQIGHRDHTTVLHGVRQTLVRIREDEQFRRIVLAHWPAFLAKIESKESVSC